MQVFYFLQGDEVAERCIAAPEASVVPGVPWGRPDELFTAAYWMTQYWMHRNELPRRGHRIGETFEEEVVACLLGGHGIPAEVGLAAFKRLRDRGLISEPIDDTVALSDVLREPLSLEGRQIVYRFWSQKAKYVLWALRALREEPPPLDSSRALRDHLLQLPGIGPKTASWIVRNWLGSNDVAILDVHVIRAGQLMGLFTSADRVEHHYFRMERRFLDFAGAIGVPAADLDALIWHHMRSSPRLVASLLSTSGNDRELSPRLAQHLQQPRHARLQDAKPASGGRLRLNSVCPIPCGLHLSPAGRQQKKLRMAH